ncbi:MAG: lipoyl(octanoyl) transferase LipB [Chloroflexi bacterium]|nr:lipoyl(octanoyl) transferase LipB [Chloroflexota bacterium]
MLELGHIGYPEAWALQQQLVERRLADAIPDTLLLLEHSPVITLGRRAGGQDLLVPRERLEALGIAVHRSSRGGLATYHGPGQLVVYVIARLRELAPNVPAFVHGLEEIVVRALAEAGLEAWREAAHPGVWTRGGKIAAIGVALYRGITLHGLAVNLQPDLGHFGLINPCGLGDLGVTSYRQATGRELDLSAFGRQVALHFGQVFGRQIGLGERPGARRGAAALKGEPGR